MPYLSFSQRMGIKPIEVPIQTDCLNEDTRMDIWNRFYQWFSSCVSDSGYMINLGMNKKIFVFAFGLNICGMIYRNFTPANRL